MHQFIRLVGVVHVKNEIAVRFRSATIGHQAVIDGFEAGDVDRTDFSDVDLTSQQFCYTFLP